MGSQVQTLHRAPFLNFRQDLPRRASDFLPCLQCSLRLTVTVDAPDDFCAKICEVICDGE
jgi:hypothetical protein